MAGALTGVHRLEVDKPHPFKPDEEKKHGGKIHGHDHHHKLGRKRGGSVKKKTDGIVGQDGKPSNHGTDATHDRGLKFGTNVQGVPMSGTESGYGGKTAFGKGHIEDSLKDGGKVKWLKGAIKHPGALHEELHVPAGEKIPEKKLEKASHSGNSTLRRRANLAKTMKGFHRKD